MRIDNEDHMTKEQRQWFETGMLVDVNQAIKFLHCSKQTFFNRVRDGIYREARFRKDDPPRKTKIFRMPELIVDEERRIKECLRRGEKTGWEGAIGEGRAF